jgi:hypothetical protein
MARGWHAATTAAGRRMACAMGRMDRATVDRRDRRRLLGVTFIDRVRKDSVVGHPHLRGAMIGMAAMAVQISLAATVPTDRQ